MSFFSICALVAIVFSQVARSSQQFTLTCPTNDVIERGQGGPPGKRGPKGEPGMKGQQGVKGEQGQSDDSRETIDRLEQKLVELENHFNQKEAYSVVLIIPTYVSLFFHNELYIGKQVSNQSNCDDLYEVGFTVDGFYEIVVNEKMLEVYCEFQRNDNNWMIFQKRFSGEVDFYRNWKDYVEGFGQKHGEFWLGLKKLHSILSTGRHMLRVDIEDWEGNAAYAEYRTFSIGDESTNYRSTFEDYSGNAGDSLTLHNNRQFTTKDRDNDDFYRNCSIRHIGAWWYVSCHRSNLNGKYYKKVKYDDSGMVWYNWKRRFYSLKKSEMKIRPIRQ